MSDFDSPWKETLDMFLEPFLRLFFPAAHAGIEWAAGYEPLDKELQQILRDAELGPRLADKLFKVRRNDGQEAWVLIHIEVQNQVEENFSERMYTYNYRIFDRYRRPVVSLAVLGDDRDGWRPTQYDRELWGCAVRFQFPIVKLLDYAARGERLLSEPNPLAAVLVAHLKSRETRHDPARRHVWKLQLVKGLFDRGLSATEIRQLFRVIDWLMELPPELERQFAVELDQFERERSMPYVTSIERIAREDGLQVGFQHGVSEGIEKGIERGIEQGRTEGEAKGLRDGIAVSLEAKFGDEGAQMAARLGQIVDVAQLRSLVRAVCLASSPAEFTDHLQQVLDSQPSLGSD